MKRNAVVCVFFIYLFFGGHCLWIIFRVICGNLGTNPSHPQNAYCCNFHLFP